MSDPRPLEGEDRDALYRALLEWAKEKGDDGIIASKKPGEESWQISSEALRKLKDMAFRHGGPKRIAENQMMLLLREASGDVGHLRLQQDPMKAIQREGRAPVPRRRYTITSRGMAFLGGDGNGNGGKHAPPPKEPEVQVPEPGTRLELKDVPGYGTVVVLGGTLLLLQSDERGSYFLLGDKKIYVNRVGWELDLPDEVIIKGNGPLGAFELLVKGLKIIFSFPGLVIGGALAGMASLVQYL